MSDVVVLGGGIAGISAAYHSQLGGLKSTVLEARDKPGGLVANFEVKGFRFDNAIHLSFTKDEYVRSVFDKTEYISHTPESYCFDNGMWLKHPVQNNLERLTSNEKVKLIESLMVRPDLIPKNYREWLYTQYGAEISERFPIPYTRKYWGVEPEDLSLSWIGDRLRKADFGEVLRGAFDRRDENHYYANEMRYPKKGGYFSFVEDMTNEIDIQCDKKITNVDLSRKCVLLEDGCEQKYEKLINTIPLPQFIPMIEGVPGEVMDAAKSLRWTTVDLISLGFPFDSVAPHLWFYIYDKEKLAARGYSPSWKSPDNAPKGCSSLQFEIYNINTADRLDPEKLKRNVIKSLIDMGVCKEHDPLFVHHKHLPFGNVVFDHGMEERRKIISDYLDFHGVKSAGRFGEWGYLWSDQSFLSGKAAAESL